MTRSEKTSRATSRRHARRGKHPSSTRTALVTCATEIFADHGYAGTSLDEVVAAAQVTKGALYHHYSGKQALFEAVFEDLQEQAVSQIRSEIKRERDPWDRAAVGVRAFMNVCAEPHFRRIVMQEAPVALGYERFREADERHTYGLVRGIVAKVLEPQDVPESIVETFTRVFYGATSAAGMSVALSDDPEAAGREVETVIGIVLAGLRQLAESGVTFEEVDLTSPS
ncbi:MAG: TetR/AcrR family transcriptional regulator [Nocardioidaceae bacterium]